MKQIKILLILQLIFLQNLSFSQAQQYRALAVGDNLPDLEIKHLINYPTPTAHLSDFRGKVLILDFWATWCSPCIAAFPRMDSLRKTFGDKLFILPVTDQDEKTVSSLLTNMQKVKGKQGFSVVRDTILKQLFKHSEIPHYVWIDQNGIVSAITDGEQVNELNIQKFLNKQPFTFAMKNDIRRLFDANRPLGTGINTIDNADIVDYHIFSRYIPGFTSSLSFKDPVGKPYELLALNISLETLYQMAYGEFWPRFMNDFNSTVIESKDSVKISGPFSRDAVGREAWDQWMKNDTYCYQRIVSSSDTANIFQYMREDLDRQFPQLQASIEKRKGKCLVLVSSDQGKQINTKGGQREVADNKYNFHLQNAPWYFFSSRLQTYYLQTLATPLVDETKISGNVDLEIVANLSNVTELRAALKNYNIEIIEAERDIDMIVIRDRPISPISQKTTNVK